MLELRWGAAAIGAFLSGRRRRRMMVLTAKQQMLLSYNKPLHWGWREGRPRQGNFLSTWASF
jgi:hypothetical protein